MALVAAKIDDEWAREQATAEKQNVSYLTSNELPSKLEWISRTSLAHCPPYLEICQKYPHTVTYKYTRGDENTDALCRIDADPDGKVKTVVGLSDLPSDWAYFECFQKRELLQWLVVSFKAERHDFADDYDSCKRIVSRQLQAGTGAYDIYVKTTSSYYIRENLFF